MSASPASPHLPDRRRVAMLGGHPAQPQVHEIRVHDARHTAAIVLIDQGVRLRVAQDVLGHGPAFYDDRISHSRKTRNHVRQLEALGYEVKLQPAA